MAQINIKSIHNIELTKEEQESYDRLTEQSNTFKDFCYNNFDFHLIYEEFKTGVGYLPNKDNHIYVKVHSGFNRNDFDKLNRATFFDEKAYIKLHEACYPILKAAWEKYKFHNKHSFNPMKRNIHFRSPSGHKSLYFFTTSPAQIF